MFALRNTAPYELARKVKLMLTDALVWYDSFRTSSDLKREIINWIQKDQLQAKGVDGNDVVIGYYSYVTSLINPKKRFNTPYTLNDTGDFFKDSLINPFGVSV